MVRHTPERVLIIGDSQRQLQAAISQAMPNAHITSVSTVFDGIGELSVNTYTTILAAAEPIERRPEPAVRMLRQLAGEGRLVLFGHPTLEILSRKMLQFGCDDYIITPANSSELQQLFEGRSLRIASPEAEPVQESAVAQSAVATLTPPAPAPIQQDDSAEMDPGLEFESDAGSEVLRRPGFPPLDPGLRSTSDPASGLESEPSPHAPQSSPAPAQPFVPAPPPVKQALPELPFADIFLDAMLQTPHDAPSAAVRMLNERLAPDVELKFVRPGGEPIEIPVGCTVFSHPMRAGTNEVGTLHLLTFSTDDPKLVEEILAQIANLIGKLAALQERHNRLQKLSITDDLTGLYNCRYFRHFLGRLVERAKNERFNVTLLLFDIDDFKKYNDAYGHGAGDEILKQTAKLMKRCCREHDLVARIGGDEFAVVFWDKEGPRKPLDPTKPLTVSRAPQTPVQMFERFKRLAASSDFAGLGQSGREKLSVSGGLAVYPYDARDVPSLIKAADDYLMFKAKKAGKNSVYLVEGNENGTPRS